MRVHNTSKALRRSLVLVFTALLIVSALPLADATVSTTYGKIVAKKTSTSEPNTVTFHATTFAVGLIKPTTAGGAGSEDWYVDFDSSGAVSVGDLRLSTVTALTSLQFGTKVKSGEGDIGNALSGTAGALCYIDTYIAGGQHSRGTNRFNPPIAPTTFVPEGEPLYVQKGGACGNVAAGNDQLRVTKAPSSRPALGGGTAGSKVLTGNTDIGNATRTLTTDHAAAVLRFVDLDKSGTLSIEDPVYLSLANAAQPQPGDVRLFAGSTFGLGSEPYGSHVEADDFDVSHTLTLSGGAAVRFDAEGGGSVVPTCSTSTLQHSIYLDWANDGDVDAGDIRLAIKSGGTGTVGHAVRSSDTVVGNALTALPANSLTYADMNGDAVFNYGDRLMLDVGGGSPSGAVSAGDIRLSTSTAGQIGTCVIASNTDINQPLITTALPADPWRYQDAWNAAAYVAGQPVYFANAATVGIGDVRMTSLWTTFGAHGSVVDDDDIDRTWVLTGLAGTRAICFTASSGATYRLEDPVYIAVAGCGANLAAGDIRLTGTGTYAAGTAIRVGEGDFNNPLTALAGSVLRYAESGTGNSASYDSSDWIYVDADGTGAPGTAQVTDIRVTQRAGFTPGSKVQQGASDISDSLRDFPAAAGGAFALANLAFFKVVPSTGSFSAGYRPGDVVVYDTNANGLLDIGDIFLIGTGGTTSLVGATSGGGGGGGGGGTSTPSTNPSAAFSLNKDDGARLISVNGAASTAVTGRTITAYAWTFGDGGTANGVQATHTYAGDGAYIVRLTVTDSSGATGSSQQTVIFGPASTTSPSPTPTESETPSPTASEEPTDTASPTDNATRTPAQGTPGPALVLVVGALVVAAAVVARRRR